MIPAIVMSTFQFIKNKLHNPKVVTMERRLSNIMPVENRIVLYTTCILNNPHSSFFPNGSI